MATGKDGQAAGSIPQLDDLTERLIERTAGAVGEAFLQALVVELTLLLQTRYAFVARPRSDEPALLRTIAASEHGRLQTDFEYAAADGPCAGVLLSGGQAFFAEDLPRRFPRSPLAEALGAQSYLGVALRRPSGAPAGILVLLDDRPRQDSPTARRLLTCAAARAAAELERLETESALRQSEARYRTLIQTSPDAIVLTDANGRFLTANPQLAALHGYRDLEELLSAGLTAFDLLAPEERERAKVEGQRLSAEGPQRGVLYRGLRKDGSTFTLELSRALLRGPAGEPLGLITIARDVSARTVVADELRASRERLRDVLEHSSSLFFSSTTDHVLTYVSPRSREFFDCSPEEACVPWTELLTDHPQNAVGLDHTERALRSGQRRGRYEMEVRTRTGRTLWVEVDEAPVVREGRTVAVVGALTNVTQRKQAREEKIRLEAELLQSQKMEAVGRLAGGMAHDFNNLLTVILGQTELALRAVGERAGVGPRLVEVRDAALRARDVTRQILAFSRRQVLSMEPLDLAAEVATLEGLLRRLIGEDIDLRRERPDGPLWVRADRAQLQQIVMNLAVNARDAMPEGGRLTIGVREVVLGEADEPDLAAGTYALLSVSDTGCGMAPEVLGHLFEPFFTTKQAGEGTGLGLATVYGIVRQHGGHVDATSEPGQGSTFRVFLRRVEPPGEPAAAAPPIAAGVEEEAARRRETILIVEDEQSVREMLVGVLGDRGYQVLEASDPRQALEVARAHPGTIDLLLSDVVMPGLRGPDLHARLKADRPEVKVLYMSGYSGAGIAESGVLPEGAELLQKPFLSDDLERRLRAVLDRA